MMRMIRGYAAKVLQFGLIGGAVFGLGQGLLVLFIEVLHWHSLLANAVQLVVTFGLNFWLNSIITWRDRSNGFRALMRFMATRSAGLALSFVIYAVLIQLDCHYLFANAVGVMVVMIVNFIVGETWAFRKAERKRSICLPAG